MYSRVRGWPSASAARASQVLAVERDDPRVVRSSQQRLDGFPSARAEVESPVVDVHPDEFVGPLMIEIAAVFFGVFQSFLAVVERRNA